MSSYTFSITLQRSYDESVDVVRAALEEQGFGVLSEIDLKEKLKDKLDVDVPSQVILGPCRPPLAYKAIQAEPSIAALLPCNVVVRSVSDSATLVEAFDPEVMMGMADNDALHEVARDAKRRLSAALASLKEPA